MLHNLEIIHMDIKPENIFISYGGICKIGDFGLSINLRNMQNEIIQEGDPKYLALEVLERNLFTKKSDIFSVALAILEIVIFLD